MVYTSGLTEVIPIDLPAGTYSSGLWLPDIRSDFFFVEKDEDELRLSIRNTFFLKGIGDFQFFFSRYLFW